MEDKLKELRDFFKPNQLYTRQEIHGRFGGNPRSGFSISKSHPAIFVFTSEEGKTYGYEDGWRGDGLLHITGEGQIGNMLFLRGNKAVRDHTKDGRVLLYFEDAKGGKRRYSGELRFFDYYRKEIRDKKNDLREGIIFRFQSVEGIKIDKEQDSFEKRSYTEGAELRVVQTTKERNPALRKHAIEKYGTVCMVCGFDFDSVYGLDLAKGYIEVHHETMLSAADGEREVSVDEVKVVCSNCHRMIHRKKIMMDWKALKDRLNT
jgi:5-methylcytosine-specific restriction enzyme A